MSEECFCRQCGVEMDSRRSMLGYATCMECGEVEARQVKHCIVPMPKSNYIVVSDVSLLLGLNNSHKGGMK
jgi:hypothetical protein